MNQIVNTNSIQTASAQIDATRVKLLSTKDTSTEAPTLGIQSLTYPDFTYRHDWGLRNGWWRLTLTDPRIRKSSNVFVSLSELDPLLSTTDRVPDPFIGAARFAVYNVAPRGGAVEILIHIDWSEPIFTQVSYLIVNP